MPLSPGLCPDMKMTTLEGIANALENNTGEVNIDPLLVEPARAALERMLRISLAFSAKNNA